MGIGIGDVALFQALPRLGSRLSLLLTQCLTAPLGALIEWFWLGTTLSAGQIAWGLIALIGVGIALMPGEHLNRSRGEFTIGTLFCLVSAFGGGFGAVLSRKAYAIAHACNQPIDGANAAFQRALGGLFVAALVLLVVKRRLFKVQAHAPYRLVIETSKQKWRGVWLWVLINGVAGQTLGVSCMQWALETTPTGIVLAIIALTPILIIPVAYVMEGERPTAHSLLGGVVAVAGAIGLALSR